MINQFLKLQNCLYCIMSNSYQFYFRVYGHYELRILVNYVLHLQCTNDFTNLVNYQKQEANDLNNFHHCFVFQVARLNDYKYLLLDPFILHKKSFKLYVMRLNRLVVMLYQQCCFVTNFLFLIVQINRILWYWIHFYEKSRLSLDLEAKNTQTIDVVIKCLVFDCSKCRVCHKVDYNVPLKETKKACHLKVVLQ